MTDTAARLAALRENAHKAGKEGKGTHRNAGDAGRVAALWMEARILAALTGDSHE